MKTIPEESLLEMADREARIPTIERTITFMQDMKKNPEGEYTNFYNQKLHTPTMRIMWLLACELSDNPNMSATQLANILHDYVEEVEVTNGGRFE